MTLFSNYPDDGSEVLPKRKGGNSRRGYGLKLQQLTGQAECAYCGISLVDEFYHWLLLTVDHVIPQKESEKLGIPAEWYDSYSNLVLCCSGCNGFKNRDLVEVEESEKEWSQEDFFRLRNVTFEKKKKRILEGREEEIGFYNTSPWLDDQS